MFSTVKPFIKWAGGKSQLLGEIRKKYPRNIKKYCEPFVGGGAVLLDILGNFTLDEVMVNDINSDLINTYNQVKNNVEELVLILSEMQRAFCESNTEERKKIYLNKRARYNALKVKNSENCCMEKAALFIFLNKTCFNGLYRVNRNGLFNVPMGSYKNPSICDADNLHKISKLLHNVKINCGNYTECLDFIDEETFVYIDPPYRPLSVTSSFTSYNENDFNDEEQIALVKFIDEITSKKAKVIASNSDPKNTNEDDDFFDNLYSSYTINRVTAKRMINSKGNSRGCINELLICNY